MELSIGQVLAASAATVVGAVLAKVFNLWGTIPGVAFLSVFSAIGSVLILRAIRRTGDRVKAQIQAMAPKGPAKGTAVTVRLDPESVTATAKIPDAAQLKSVNDGTVEMPVIDPAPAGHITNTQSRKRTLLAILATSVLVFGLTIGTLYVIGALAGDSGSLIRDDRGTSGDQAPSENESPAETDEEAPDESATPSESPSASETPSETPTAEATPDATETPTESPDTDTDLGQGGDDEEPTSDSPEDSVTESPAAD